MTLEQQVHQLQVAVDNLKRVVERQARLIEALQKDSHPPVDIVARVAQAINNREMILYTAGKIVYRAGLGD